MTMKTGFYCLLFVACSITPIFSQSGNPVFNNLQSSISVSENLPVPSDILFFNITTNVQAGQPLTLQCIPTDSSPTACDTFRFVSLNSQQNLWYGKMYLNAPLDYYIKSSYLLHLQARGDSVTDQYLNISVILARYRPPLFQGSLNTQTTELNSTSVFLIQYRAVPYDNLTFGFPITYRIVPGVYSSYFSLDGVSGRLTNVQPLLFSDPLFSSTGEAVLQIEAAYVINNIQAWGNSSTSTKVNSSIYLTENNNFYAPVFDKMSYSGSVKETALPSTFVDSIFMTVTDADRSIGSSTFDLKLDAENDKFEVTPSGGQKKVEARISVKSNLQFNYNNGPRWYAFNVIATETGPDKKTSSAAVNVSLVQVNRNAPIFVQNPYNVSVHEMAVAGTTVVQVQAWDADVGIFGNDSIRYRIAQGAGDTFRMSELGLLTVAPCRNPGRSPCLDYESVNARTYNLIVFAMDLRGEGFTSTATVIINVLNDNDNSPIFSFQTYYMNITDNSTTLNGPPINATDADGDVLRFQIKGGNDKNLWNINPSTGVITPNRPILYTDAPNNGSFTLVIEASDTTFSNLANVLIKVLPVNRYPPKFNQNSFVFNISENIPQGSTVGTVQATDLDPPQTPGGTLVYRLTSGGMNNFDVKPNTGEIFLKPGGQLNSQTVPSYNLSIEVSDQGTVPFTDRTTATIYVLPTRPFLSLPSLSYVINDGRNINEVVTTIVPLTSVQNPIMQFSFIEPITAFDVNRNPITNMTSDEKAMFRIDNNGIVQVNKPLNYERIPYWQSIVKAVETTSQLTATGTLSITITPINKKPPIFNPPWNVSSPFYTISIDQGNITNPNIGNFPAVSPNQSLSILYELREPGPQNYFKLQSETSGIVLQVQPINDLSRNLTFYVIAKDNGVPSLSSTATVNVIVNANNLYAPTFTQSLYTASIYENATVGSSVVQVTATDPDPGDFGIVRYAIYIGQFAINESSGLITVAQSGSFDAAKTPTIQFYVDASDSPNNPSKRKISTAFVNVLVIDINDHDPVFQINDYRIQIQDTTIISTPIITVVATDGDLGENANLAYSIISGNEQGLFSINSNTGTISVLKSLKGRTETFYLYVNATDNGVPRRSATSKVSILVASTCGSLCRPVWSPPFSTFSSLYIPENAPIGSVISTLSASKYDGSSGSLTFGFDVAGAFNQSFDIFRINDNNPSPSSPLLYTANLTTTAKLDYNQKNLYNLKVAVRDNSISGSNATTYIDVHVTKVTTLNPQFTFNSTTNCVNSLSVSLPANTPPNIAVTQVTAKPNHNDDIVLYSIVNGATNPLFSINENTGQLSLNRRLPENVTSYAVTVKAKYFNQTEVIQACCLCADGSDQSLVTIWFTFVPLFANPRTTFCIDRSSELGATVLQLSDQVNQAYFSNVDFREDPSSKVPSSLSLQTNGDINLRMAASNISESFLGFNAMATPRSTPDWTATIGLDGFLVNRVTDLTLVTLKTPLNTFLTQQKDEFLNYIRNQTGYVCYVDASYHTTDSGTLASDQTDVFIYTFDQTKNVIPPLKLDQIFGTVISRQKENIVGITGAISKWDGFNYKGVAIAIGLIIGLLLLSLLFFCCCCFWPFLSRLCVKGAEKEPFISRAPVSGMVNRNWASQQQLQEQHLSLDVPDGDGTLNKTIALHGQYDRDDGDADILQSDSFKMKQDDVTFDGRMSSGSIPIGVPPGYVHIEAPLDMSRSTSAMAGSDINIKSNLGDAHNKTITTTTIQESYERGKPYANGSSAYMNQEEISKQSSYSQSDKLKDGNKARAYSSRSGFMEEDEPDKPVQLNDPNMASNKKQSSMIGATLIKPEPMAGHSFSQNIISGTEPNFIDSQASLPGYDYINYDGTYVADPSRFNMAFQNEVVFNGMRPVSQYEDIGGTLISQAPSFRNDISMNPMSGDLRQESKYMEQFEETRFL